MTAGELAALVAATAFALLVGASLVPLRKLGRALDEVAVTVRGVREDHAAQTAVAVEEASAMLARVGAQMQRVESVTDRAEAVTAQAAAVGSLVTSTLGRPLARTAALSYGVRRAVADRRAGRRVRRGRAARR